MAPFDPVSALLGGALIGLASALLMLLVGRVAGISGIVGGGLARVAGDSLWRFAFIAGLVLAPFASGIATSSPETPRTASGWLLIAIAGLLVGFGARLGGGCTSGHGVCGLARFSPRSIIATAIFMATAIVVVAVTRHGPGG